MEPAKFSSALSSLSSGSIQIMSRKVVSIEIPRKAQGVVVTLMTKLLLLPSDDWNNDEGTDCETYSINISTGTGTGTTFIVISHHPMSHYHRANEFHWKDNNSSSPNNLAHRHHHRTIVNEPEYGRHLIRRRRKNEVRKRRSRK
mmetsp:Transcript_32093/g.34517  ORF Transcript_32093/g.34517 Transcript_32093/m.34517 type:complete len:144 (-) Transcript_32093:149-580(-)